VDRDLVTITHKPPITHNRTPPPPKPIGFGTILAELNGDVPLVGTQKLENERNSYIPWLKPLTSDVEIYQAEVIMKT
jgi:hypothetical protein